MNFNQSIESCFTNFSKFRGRATRSEFWWFWLFFAIATFIGDNLGGLFSFIVLILVIPYVSAGVRRMHDSGRSGWWLLFPLLNLYFLALPSDSETNKYGPPSSKTETL